MVPDPTATSASADADRLADLLHRLAVGMRPAGQQDAGHLSEAFQRPRRRGRRGCRESSNR